jgi:hypothetical protein
MATSRTLPFLPEIFQTDTNKKFLSATLDQLVSEPDFIRFNGYVGRKFAPTYQFKDTYIPEITVERENYQLEPSVITKAVSGAVEQYSGYTDLINKLNYYGAQTSNHDRMFNSEMYTYDGLFDFDKFINYSQYYWLPNGIEPVAITSAIVGSQRSFILSKDENTDLINVNSETGNNPPLTLVRGGSYKFYVNQPGAKVWIQTEPGTTGHKRAQVSVSTRDILGVTNNGTDLGFIEFSIPLEDAQDEFLKMPIFGSVDYATTESINDIAGKLFHTLTNGIDGSITSPDYKTIIFLSSNNTTIYKIRLTQNGDDTDLIVLTPIQDVPENYRVYIRSGQSFIGAEFYNHAGQLLQVPTLTSHLDKLYYQDSTNPAAYGTITLVNDAVELIDVEQEILGKPVYTSPGQVVFTNGLMIKFDATVTPSKYANNTYVVEGVGRSIKLVKFDDLAFPEPGLADAGQVPWDYTPYAKGSWDESFKGPPTPDYVVCNRGLLDLNAWARQNRWFHVDVIVAAAGYNNTVPTFDHATRAQRPIIEFDSSAQLFNNGRIGKSPIDVIDSSMTDVFGDLHLRSVDFVNQGLKYTLNFTPTDSDVVTVTAGGVRVPESQYTIIGNKLTLSVPQMGFDIKVEARSYQDSVQHSRSLVVNGVEFKEGQRVLFAADKDELVRTQVYRVQYALQNDSVKQSYYDGKGSGQISIEPDTINFASVRDPEIVLPPDGKILHTELEYNRPTMYTWEVIGSPKILTAIEVRGLDYSGAGTTGTITQIDDLGSRHYLIHYTTPYVPMVFNNFDVKLVGPTGSDFVFGINTKFTTDLKIGGAVYDIDGKYIGTVAFIVNDTKLRLETHAAEHLINAEFYYRDPRIQLIVSADPDDVLTDYDSIVSLGGPNKGVTFWYDGIKWNRGQQKQGVNQPPKFDIFDLQGRSLSDGFYKSSKFTGTNIFSYKTGSGTADTVLGFPLSYRNFNSIADIQFNNNFDLDQFEYLVDNSFVSKNINVGYLRENTSRTEFVPRTAWTTCREPSKQYQIINNVAAGDTNYFAIDVLPDVANTIPTLKVFVNNMILDVANYEIVKIGAIHTIFIKTTIIAGDNIDILIYNSSETSAAGYYQIPDNLNYNSKNSPVPVMSLGQIRNHVTLTGQNALDLTGQLPGDSNLRDIDIKSCGGNILQAVAPTVYASLFLISKQINFINSIDYAKKEYTKFKNKFLETAVNLAGLDFNDPSSSVDTIIETINAAKNPSFPWYMSDMVPYGNYTATQYTVTNPRMRQFKIDSIFDAKKLQSRAVMVYNGKQLLTHGVDYEFATDRPSVFITESVHLITGSIIEIREYVTDGNYIPETPTKLGLYPSYIPKIFTDDTYLTPIQVIRGHDGSITPAFGDFRDFLLLELETRIYNNIKIDHGQTVIDIRDYIPGRFRSTEYSLKEFNSIIQASLLKWAGLNQVDLSTNSYFQSGEEFTYNYSYSTDSVYDQPLPGYWRGIYRYFFDTDRPHSAPWEMLGFTDQPTWWTLAYGPAPYTSENKALWKDLEAGTIRQGSRAGTYSKYARPDLSKVIPVDEHGNLLSPLARVAKQFNGGKVSEVFALGDGGPAETAWQKSSEYPFALQQAVALMKPAVYFATLFDTTAYRKNIALNQYQISTTGNRITPASMTIPGEIINGVLTRTSGYINYIADYLISLGISAPGKIRSLLDNFDIQLAYRVAGFTDKKYLTALADQYSPTSINESIIIPDQNYQIQLNKSVPTNRAVYSAVIVKKSESGYTVTGYDTSSPYFTIIPSNISGENYQIKVQDISAVIYTSYQFAKLTVPYGYEFTSRQQLVDFLVSYQRYLNSQGFLFEEYNQDLSATQDWVVSAKEFLTWTLQGWKTGSLIILSPCNSKLNLISEYSVVDEITNEPLGSKILDPNFSVIKKNNLAILRQAGNFTIQTADGTTIAYAELDLVQFEHVLIFDNNTIFNDVVYVPELGSRQYRIKLVGNKTNNWDGSLNAPGFIYNSTQVDAWKSGVDYLKGDIVSYKNAYYVALTDLVAASIFSISDWRTIDKTSIKTGLLPNFSTNASKAISAYDVDTNTVDEQTQQFSSGLIGFRNRNYLNDLNINTTSQIKFYQGYIRDKGTKNAVNALKSTSFNNLQNNISYFEEWAMRVGEYGAQKSNQTVEIRLSDAWASLNNLGITLTDNGDNMVVPGIVPVKDKSLYSRPFHRDPVRFLNRNNNSTRGNDIQTAGYVNLNDIDATIFDSNSYDSLKSDLNNIVSGYTIWIAKGVNRDWDVYRANETNNTVEKISYALDLSAEVVTKHPHGLAVGDTVIIKQFNTDFDGFHTVTAVGGDRRSFTIATTNALNMTLRTSPLSGNGTLMVLHSLRFPSPKYIANATPLHTWKDGDLTWVDADQRGLWTVYEKQSPWEFTDSIEIANYQHRANSLYGTSVRINPKGTMMVIGSPGEFNDLGRFHIFYNNQSKKEVSVLPIKNIALKGLGQSVDYTDLHVIAGAPGSNQGTGAVIVYSLVADAYARPVQYIYAPEQTQHSSFGWSISASRNGEWLYVGSPGIDQVHVYQLQNYEFKTTAFSANPNSTHYTLHYHITDPDSIAVYYKDTLLKLGVDYTILNNTIVLEPSSQYANSDLSMLIPELAAPGFNDFLVVTQRSYYAFSSTIQGTAGSLFGSSVKTENTGRLVVVGAPDATVNGIIYAGAAYIYKNIDDLKLDSSAIKIDTNKIQVDGGYYHMTSIQDLTADVPTYRGRFGVTVEVCPNDCSIYIGAPGYSYRNYSGGAVFRFVNAGLVLGSVVGIPTTTTLTRGAVEINGHTIRFNGGSLGDFVDAVNNEEIIGVTAKQVGDSLVISSTVTEQYKKLDLMPLSGDLINQLGIVLFQRTQTIIKPLQSEGDRFGSRLRVSPDAETLLISSLDASMQLYMAFDKKTTTFDGDTTKLIDYSMGTGVVYSYDYLPSSPTDTDPYGTFGYSQEFGAAYLVTGDKFGNGIDFSTDTLIIGAALHDNNFLPHGHNSGEVYRFINKTGNKGWKQLRQEMPVVEVTGINGIKLFNDKTKTTLAQLDYIDPVKGKILGIASQDIDYKSSSDPASYNAGTTVDQTLSDEYHWNSAQVGKTWWNLDRARFINYEQEDLNYRLKNWGKLFPNSKIEVYEWVASTVVPSKYSSFNSGTPLHADDSAYVIVNGVDPTTGIISTTYYYWVRGLTTVPYNSTRTLSVTALENTIADPKSQNVPFAAILSDNSIGLYNCQDYISSNNTILQINYDTILNINVMHNEFELVEEGNGALVIPSRIVNKLIDSLSGIDYAEARVPDIGLPPAQQVGLNLRPRQTLVIDKSSALQNLTQYVNSVFASTAAAAKLQNSLKFMSTYWFHADQEPLPTEYNYRVENINELAYVNTQDANGNQLTGLKVLIANDADYFNIWTLRELTASGTYKLIRNQAYDTTKLWNFNTWYADGYAVGTKPKYVVSEYKDIEKLNISVGDIVKVLDNGANGFDIYQFTTETDGQLVATEHGTLKISDLIWDLRINDVGFDNGAFDTTTFDKDYSQEIRNILFGLQKNILVDDLADSFNRMIFVVVEYILTEQKNVDWIFKTSFINVLHKIRELQQYPVYIKDNTTYYRQYIDEVKPYRTKIREYKIAYTGTDVAGTNASDFDVPAYYDTKLGRFRSPSTEHPAIDGILYSQPDYIDWNNNFLNHVENIIVTNKGSGYTEPPRITVLDSEGTGTGVVATATINELLGTLERIVVESPGKYFRGQPQIIIQGTGTGATAVGILANHKTRSIKTLLKFDRVTYETDITEWLPNNQYSEGAIVSYKGKGYVATAPVPHNNLFNYLLFKELSDSEYTNALDRIAARYHPDRYQVPKEFDPVTGKIDVTRIVPRPGVNNSIDTSLDLEIDTFMLSPANADDATGTENLDINISGGGLIADASSNLPEELVPGITFDTLNMQVITDIGTGGAAYKTAYRLFKGANDITSFYAIVGARTAKLTQDLNYNDTDVYIDNMNLAIGIRMPGAVFVGTEKIIFRHFDVGTNRIYGLVRGADNTPIPLVHPTDSRVESIGANVILPGVMTTQTSKFVFNKSKPNFTTDYAVAEQLDTVKNQIGIFIGPNQLILNTSNDPIGKRKFANSGVLGDYNVELDAYGHIIITFTQRALDRISDDIPMSLVYNKYAQFQNDNTTLEDSTLEPAVFLKNNPYY